MRLRGFSGEPAGGWRRILVLDLAVPREPLEDRVLAWTRSRRAISSRYSCFSSLASATSARASAYLRWAACIAEGDALTAVMSDPLLLWCVCLASGVPRGGASLVLVIAQRAKACDLFGVPGVMSERLLKNESDRALLGVPILTEYPVRSIASSGELNR